MGVRSRGLTYGDGDQNGADACGGGHKRGGSNDHQRNLESRNRLGSGDPGAGDEWNDGSDGRM